MPKAVTFETEGEKEGREAVSARARPGSQASTAGTRIGRIVRVFIVASIVAACGWLLGIGLGVFRLISLVQSSWTRLPLQA